jgi:hypothetical protein
MAICASHHTGFSGKSYRGRTYLGGWAEAANDSIGQVAASYRTLIQNAFDTLRSNLATGVTNGVELAVISRTLLVATPITATTVNASWDHQDRRKRS